MITNFELFNIAMTAVRNEIESWLIVMRFLVSFKSNEDFDVLRPDREGLSHTNYRRSSGCIRSPARDRRDSDSAHAGLAGKTFSNKRTTASQTDVSNRVTGPMDSIETFTIAR